MKIVLILILCLYLFTGCTDTAEPVELSYTLILRTDYSSVDKTLLNSFGFSEKHFLIQQFSTACYSVNTNTPESELNGYTLQNIKTEIVSGESLQTMSAPSCGDLPASGSMTVTGEISAVFELDVADPMVIGKLLGFMPESYISINETTEYTVPADVPRVNVTAFPLYKRYSFEVYKKGKYIERGYANLPYGVAFVVSPTIIGIPQ